jgi:hypothetical protein
MVTLVVLFAPE